MPPMNDACKYHKRVGEGTLYSRGPSAGGGGGAIGQSQANKTHRPLPPARDPFPEPPLNNQPQSRKQTCKFHSHLTFEAVLQTKNHSMTQGLNEIGWTRNKEWGKRTPKALKTLKTQVISLCLPFPLQEY